MAPLNLNISTCHYQVMLGVGGIGTGVFFSINGNHTLGREESRSGHFIDRQDYCKLHIIMHYVQTLLGTSFVTLPIGRVGEDESGKRLLLEMDAVGMDLRYVQPISGSQTLHSFCFIYPDGSGGNLTTDNSACGQLTPEDVTQTEVDFSRFQSQGIALAAPEVSLASRLKLLELGTQYHFLRVAAFNSAEILPAIEMEMLTLTDLLALNRDEAAVVAGIKLDKVSPFAIVEAALTKLRGINPLLKVTITAGKEGSWSWDGKNLSYLPAFPSRLVSTAGAGDAFLAGVITGLVADLPLPQAQELGTLVAALSVTSPHTINPSIDRQSLLAYSSEFSLALSDPVLQLIHN
jgi:sugar/nucleoside kinase (ribokinase family)